jgi:saccharopine dehydrogenase (NAD+, L-lysine-forming)
MGETATGGPFPEILEHEIFLNCILAHPDTPVFVASEAPDAERKLSVIADIACDPGSDFSPIKVYDRVTTWNEPARRIHENSVLDVTAIDNLPSLLPVESSQDFADQILPSLLELGELEQGVWGRARSQFDTFVAKV